MPFDPDKYVAKKQGFDPDAYVKTKGGGDTFKKGEWAGLLGKAGDPISRPEDMPGVGDTLGKLLKYADVPFKAAFTGATGIADVGSKAARVIGETAATGWPSEEAQGELGSSFEQSFGEMGKALTGQGESPEELLAKRGIKDEEGPPDPSGGFLSSAARYLKLTPLKTALFATELALDPLNKVGALKGLSTATSLRRGGKATFKSAFKVPDAIAKEKGMKPLSDIAWEHKKLISGNKNTIIKNATTYHRGLRAKRKTEVLDAVDAKGVRGSMQRAEQPVQDKVNMWLKSGDEEQIIAAKKMQRKIDQQLQHGERTAVAGTDPALIRKRTAPPSRQVEEALPDFDYYKKKPDDISVRTTERRPEELFKGEAGGIPYTRSTPALPEVDFVKRKAGGIEFEKAGGRPEVLKKTAPIFAPSKRIPGVAPVEARSGPTVSKLTGIKTNLQKGVNYNRTTTLDNDLRKVRAKGYREEAERAADEVGMGDQLRKYNQEMGTLAGTLKAMKKGGDESKIFSPWRMFLTAVNPTAGGAMALGDILRFSGPRTMVGRGMFKIGDKGKELIPKLERRSLINLGKEEKENGR